MSADRPKNEPDPNPVNGDSSGCGTWRSYGMVVVDWSAVRGRGRARPNAPAKGNPTLMVLYRAHHRPRSPYGVFFVVALQTMAIARSRAATTPTPTGRPPNILYLMTDDQRADTLGCYGNAIIETPNIDRLAAEGVQFNRAFVTTSICMTNRACVLTGEYLSRHGVNDFRTQLAPDALAHTYLALLKEAGYRIGFIGKWGVGKPPAGLFDYNRAFAGQGRYYGRPGAGGNVHLTHRMGEQAIEFLRGCSAEQPFCLSISFKAPHVQDSNDVKARLWPADRSLNGLYRKVTLPRSPLAAPKYFDALPDFLKNSENRARWAVRFWGPARYQQSLKDYYRLVTGVDRVVGRIRQTLAARKLDQQTVILFTSDNGYYFGEYGFAGKWFPHDVSIRIPLIVDAPSMPASRRGATETRMALSIDMAPTMLDYAGIPIPKRMQGRSIRAIVDGRPPADWRHEFFYEHHFQHPAIPRSEAVRTERWKYIRYLDSQPVYEQLYDLANDPAEVDNLAGEAGSRAQLETMRGKWQAWRARVR